MPSNFGAALVPLRGILNMGVVMVAEVAGVCIVRFGEVSRRVISRLCGDGAVVSEGTKTDCGVRNQSLDVRSTTLLVRQNVRSCCT
jgi:hypothetical protein